MDIPCKSPFMDRLTEKHFSFKCPMKWEDMPASENGRYCGKCRKEVFDLTNCSIDEVAALQRKHGTICGTIKVAVAAASLATAACQSQQTVRTTGTPQAHGKPQQEQEARRLGKMMPLDQPGQADNR